MTENPIDIVQNFTDKFNLQKEWYNNTEIVNNLLSNYIISQKQVELISFLKRLLSELYPERWDIQLHFVHPRIYSSSRLFPVNSECLFYGFVITAVIHFPEVKVSNGTLKHTIKDMLVYVPFIPVGIGFHIKESFGNRFTYTLSEANINYVFSHLPRGISKDLKRFCYGEGEIYQMAMTYNATQEEQWLRMFFIQFDFYLAWESIEGGPHIKMREIQSGSSYKETLDFSTIQEAGNLLFSKIMEAESLPFTLSVVNDSITVNDNAVYEEFLKNTILHGENYEIVFEVLFYRDIKGRFRNITQKDNIESSFHKVNFSLVFQGINNPATIIEDDSMIKEETLFIHSNVKNYVTRKIEEQILSNFFAKCIRKELESPDYY